MTLPAKTGDPGDIQSDLLRRIAFLRDRTDDTQRFALIRKLLIALRDGLYPSMRILDKADGTVVVTITRPQAGGK